jgi:hypothetical protein
MESFRFSARALSMGFGEAAITLGSLKTKLRNRPGTPVTECRALGMVHDERKETAENKQTSRHT